MSNTVTCVQLSLFLCLFLSLTHTLSFFKLYIYSLSSSLVAKEIKGLFFPHHHTASVLNSFSHCITISITVSISLLHCVINNVLSMSTSRFHFGCSLNTVSMDLHLDCISWSCLTRRSLSVPLANVHNYTTRNLAHDARLHHTCSFTMAPA